MIQKEIKKFTTYQHYFFLVLLQETNIVFLGFKNDYRDDYLKRVAINLIANYLIF